MELLYDIIALLVVMIIGYLCEEKRAYFILLLFFLVPSGLLIGYFLEDVLIYGILFVLGITVERMYMTYKWQATRRPKSADYKPTHDWVMKIVATLIIILCIDMVSDVHITYSFLAFFGGVLASWVIKKFENR
ncbi:MAG: hypothetical protein KAT37_04805 [Candidatus Aenigmarchaeota archaeon]|nr:hypothetical protein [Candidatus Aenigmarchaeota archaeon]